MINDKQRDEEDEIIIQGICNDYEWCDYKACKEKGVYVCTCDNNYCQYLIKK